MFTIYSTVKMSMCIIMSHICSGNFSVQSPAIVCPKNDYIVDGDRGLPSYKIVEELADDNEVWAEAFLKGWAKFLKNGNAKLKAGPMEAWLGYYSLESEFCVCC